MFLQEWKLSRKLFLTPLVMIGLLLVLSVLCYWGLSRQKSSLNDIYTLRFRGYQNSSKILNGVSQVHANIYRVISWANAGYDGKKIKELAEEQAAAIKGMIALHQKTLASGLLSAEEKKIYQESHKQLLEYQEPALGVLDLVGSDLSISTMYMGTADDKFQILVGKLQKLSDLEEKLAKEQYDSALEGLSRLSRFFLLGIPLAFGLSLLITLQVGRTISLPIERIIKGLKDNSRQLASASLRVASTSKVLAEGASEQAAGLEETSSSMEEMASMTRQNAEDAGRANDLTAHTSKVVHQANRSMAELNDSMRETSAVTEETARIVKTIDEIAFQTNLLALNAAVEAARAGGAGSGFAVVADEVRNLALRTAGAARNTAELIEKTVRSIQRGSQRVSLSHETFAGVVSGAERVGSLVNKIAAASQEQAQGIEQINKAIAEMDRVVQKNAANAGELESAAGEMQAQAEQMEVFVAGLTALMEGGRNGRAG